MNEKLNRKTTFIDLDLIEYQKAWDYQLDLFNSLLQIKSQNRDRSPEQHLPTDNFLIFCQHPHVYTLGKSGDENNLLIKKESLSTINATYFETNRGGDITYHGPGQIVGYPVIDMENFFTDIHRYMRYLEEAVIQTLKEFGIESGRINGLTGVWIDFQKEKSARKICALGVKTSRWVTMHGFAFNVNTDLKYFDYIVPCGIQDKAVTSLEKELGKKQDLKTVESILKSKIKEQFGMEWA
jgi:lipoyl(octanoyl) transferase